MLLKVKPLIGELLDWLERRELLGHASFVERCGATDEQVADTPEALRALRERKVSYLSLMIVRSPHRVRGERIRGCLKKTSPGVAA